jgi:hypothetical protein
LKKLSLLILLVLSPILSFAKAPDCHNWPMNMTEMWMRSAGIVDFKNLNIPKTKITLLASEKKGKDLYTQIYYFVFYDQKGKSYEVITKNEASYEECSMSQVNSYLISKRDINY